MGAFALCCTALIDAAPKKVNKIKGFRYLSRFLSASLIDANLNLTKYG
jgi:hypothetical protein